jgi:hypothetical protein
MRSLSEVRHQETKISKQIRAMFADVELTEAQMHVYQDECVDFLLQNPFSALFIDLGMGKSVSSLTVIAKLCMEFTYDHILIIGPRRVATVTWPNEIRKWEHTAWLNHTLIHVMDDDPRVTAAGRRGAAVARQAGASAADANKARGKAETAEKNRLRVALARSTPTIHIISRDWVEWLCEFWGKNWPYKAVFIDESSSFKSISSTRFKALAKMRNTPGLIERLHCLTATPAAETYEHLFTQVYLMDRGERLGKFITHYRRDHFDENKYNHTHKIKPGHEELILAKIADICLVMKAEDYLDVEKPTIIQRPVYLPQPVMDLYNEMQRDFLVTLPDGSEIEAETAAALSGKLLQIASGVLYETKLLEDWETDDFKKVKKVHHIHDEKIEELKELVEESQGKPMIVAYHFKSSLDRLKKTFPYAVVMDRDGKCVKRWNQGKIKMLLMHPQSGGHGLNMQDGGHLLTFFDLIYSLELFLQIIGRLARQGQKHPVIVYILTAIGTLDETVYQSVSTKEDAQEKMFRILKRLIRKLKERKLAAMDEVL